MLLKVWRSNKQTLLWSPRIKFHQVPHYVTLMIWRLIGLFFSFLYQSNTIRRFVYWGLYRARLSLAHASSLACVANKTLSFVGNKRRRIERRKKLLSLFLLSLRPLRSFFVFLLRSPSRSRALSMSPILSLSLSYRSFAIPLLCDPSRPDGFTTHTRHEHRRASHGLLLKLVCCRAHRTAMRAGELDRRRKRRRD